MVTAEDMLRVARALRKSSKAIAGAAKRDPRPAPLRERVVQHQAGLRDHMGGPDLSVDALHHVVSRPHLREAYRHLTREKGSGVRYRSSEQGGRLHVHVTGSSASHSPLQRIHGKLTRRGFTATGNPRQGYLFVHNEPIATQGAGKE